jgi:hydrogenase maturation protease
MAILIIACGNPLRGDDGVGWEIARMLLDSRGAGVGEVGCEIVAVHQLTPELAELVSEAETVIFIDAAVGAQPGEVCVRVIDAAPEFVPEFSHSLGPAELVAIARDVFARVPRRAFLLCVGADTIAYSEGLSSVAQQAVPLAVEKIGEIFSESLLPHFGTASNGTSGVETPDRPGLCRA